MTQDCPHVYTCVHVHVGWPLELQTSLPLVEEEPSYANGVQSPPLQTPSQNWGADGGGSPSSDSRDELLHNEGDHPYCNVDDWGPLYGEDEDLKIAIQDSLQDAGASSGVIAADRADVWDPHSRRGMLVTGHEGSFAPTKKGKQKTAGGSSMLQFSSTQLHTEIPKTRINQSPSPGHLPSQLQQLLDSSERLGTNV